MGARLGNVHPSKRLGLVPQQEPMMTSLRILSTAAILALALPMAAPTASFAQHPPGRGGAPRGAPHPGGGIHPGGGAPGARFGGGGGYRGGYGGGYHGGGGGFIPGAVAGAVIGGALATGAYGYYGGGPGYYGPGYYDDQYYDDGGTVAVAPAPAPGGDAVAYCMQTYRSYDPQSGTYLGFDGYRHPCP
jgi:hypothetical protein